VLPAAVTANTAAMTSPLLATDSVHWRPCGVDAKMQRGWQHGSKWQCPQDHWIYLPFEQLLQGDEQIDVWCTE
jgi:hypothetical protein